MDCSIIFGSPVRIVSGKKCSSHNQIACSYEDCLHLLGLREGDPLICKKKPAEDVLTVKGQQKWFSQIASKVGSSEMRSLAVLLAIQCTLSNLGIKGTSITRSLTKVPGIYFPLIKKKLTCDKRSPFPRSQRAIFHCLHLYLNGHFDKMYRTSAADTLFLAFGGLLHFFLLAQVEEETVLRQSIFALLPFSFS